MNYKLVYTIDFTQTQLYTKVVTFIGDCSKIIPKISCDLQFLPA
jgi:hypothetical protein